MVDLTKRKKVEVVEFMEVRKVIEKLQETEFCGMINLDELIYELNHITAFETEKEI